MFQFDMLQSGIVIAVLFVIGERVSHRMKAAVPSILAAGVIFMVLLWCGVLPRDLVDRSGLSGLTPVAMMFVILSMGSSIKFRELAANWKVVLIAAVSYLLELSMIFLIVRALYGQNMAVAATPGSSAVALIIQEKARLLGYDECIVLSILLLSMQGLVACPLVSFLVGRETARLLADGIPACVSTQGPGKPDVIPEQSDAGYLSFLKLYIGAWIANRLYMLTGISQYVISLVLGVILAELGIYRKNELDGTGAASFFMFIMMAMMLNGFSSSTPQMLLHMLPVLALILGTEILLLSLSTLLLGRFLGFSRVMSVALGLNIMIGFPLNMMISQDIIYFLTDDPEKRDYLMERIGMRMVIAGFTSTTFLSNMMGGLMVTLMK